MPTLPDRQALRAHYDRAVNEINSTRPAIDLTKGFYAETGDGVFEAGYLALSDSCAPDRAPRRIHVVSAPAGGGKTSYSYALMMAVTRLADEDLNAPYGCIFVVDQITKADEVYRELNALMPGKVAVWSTEHDRDCKPTNRKKVPEPAALFKRDELRCYPIVVVTHAFYNGPKGNKAHQMLRNARHSSGRALVIVDERPEEVEIYETTLKEAQALRETLDQLRPDLSTVLDKLLLFMMPSCLRAQANVIERPAEAYGMDFVADELEWFTTKEADDLLKSLRVELPSLEHLFGFARALTLGCAFAVPSEQVTRFVGWQPKLMLRPGTMLLDATADIDGVTQVCPHRQHAKVPQAHYGNLSIIHVPQHTKVRLSEYLKTAGNQRAYVEAMVATIKEHMAPDEKGLVVCKKILFDQERVPPRPQGADDPFAHPESYQQQYGWDVEGRKLCAVHYGTGIGSNVWQDADVVFLFDEFHIPRRIAAAQLQGLRGHRADEGALGSMNTLNRKSKGVDLIADGHRLRWTKQLALRGRGRSYDQHGNCGVQRLVVSGALKSFMSHAQRLFPGASMIIAQRSAENTTWAEKAVQVLSGTESLPPVLTTKQLASLLGKPWRSIQKSVLTPEFLSTAESLGWTYVGNTGRKGSWFEYKKVRTPDLSLALQVPVESNVPEEAAL
jgi:hypothetical protein